MPLAGDQAPRRCERGEIYSDPNSVLDLVWPPPTTHAELKLTNDPHCEAWLPASIAFRTPAPTGDPNDVHMNHNKELVAAFRRTPKNGGSRFQSGRTLRCHKNHDGHSDVYGRIDPDNPAPTMTTACINPSKGRFVHPTEPHGITVRQAARLQSFPDWFIFEGGLMAAGAQIGNAVPPVLAKTILVPICRALAIAQDFSARESATRRRQRISADPKTTSAHQPPSL